jgi:hypothetical protein
LKVSRRAFQNSKMVYDEGAPEFVKAVEAAKASVSRDGNCNASRLHPIHRQAFCFYPPNAHAAG